MKRLVVRSQEERCEDCDLRNALDPMGRPRFSKEYGYKRTSGCDGCGGTGRGGRKMILDAGDALKVLTAKQRFVIERRYGYVDGKRYTQAEIGEIMGIGQRRVARHEELAKKKLLALFDKKGLKVGG